MAGTLVVLVLLLIIQLVCGIVLLAACSVIAKRNGQSLKSFSVSRSTGFTAEFYAAETGGRGSDAAPPEPWPGLLRCRLGRAPRRVYDWAPSGVGREALPPLQDPWPWTAEPPRRGTEASPYEAQMCHSGSSTTESSCPQGVNRPVSGDQALSVAMSVVGRRHQSVTGADYLTLHRSGPRSQERARLPPPM